MWTHRDRNNLKLSELVRRFTTVPLIFFNDFDFAPFGDFNIWLAILYCVIHFLSIFLIIAFYTLLERKIMASIQRRKGPNVNGFHGLLQPLADGLKLMFKEIIIPNRSNRFIFIFSPIFFLAIALALWSLIPFEPGVVVADPMYSVLFYLVFSTISIFGIIFAGWASNSKYPFLGALRSVAQMISYEVVLGFIILTVVLSAGSLNFMDIVEYQITNIYLFLPLSVPCIAFFIVILAETNRAPFDLAEAESELVAGYNTEYSGILFAMFFLAEYSNMITLSACGVLYFFAGWGGFFPPIINMTIKILIFMYLFVIVRAVLPRYRYDQLMRIGWRVLLPIVMIFFIVVIVFRFFPFVSPDAKIFPASDIRIVMANHVFITCAEIEDIKVLQYHIAHHGILDDYTHAMSDSQLDRIPFYTPITPHYMGIIRELNLILTFSKVKNDLDPEFLQFVQDHLDYCVTDLLSDIKSLQETSQLIKTKLFLTKQEQTINSLIQNMLDLRIAELQETLDIIKKTEDKLILFHDSDFTMDSNELFETFQDRYNKFKKGEFHCEGCRV